MSAKNARTVAALVLLCLQAPGCGSCADTNPPQAAGPETPPDTSAQQPVYEQRNQPVDADDLAILRRADEMLMAEARWDREDDRKCDASDETVSLYCALFSASNEVAGEYDHRRVALQEVRFVIDERGREYPHRLMGFNNDPRTTFSDVKAVLAEASARVESRLDR